MNLFIASKEVTQSGQKWQSEVTKKAGEGTTTRSSTAPVIKLSSKFKQSSTEGHR